jgi:hypothetical protein
MNEDIDSSTLESHSSTSTTKITKTSKPKKDKRDFPQYSIEESRKILDAIKEFNAGNPWSPAEIASALKMGKGANFFYLTAAARDYGLTIGTRETSKIEIGEIGKKFAYPKNKNEEYQATLEAFLNIDLFKKVYEYYQGENLPEIQYLKNTLKTEFGVSESLQDDFYDLYQKNLNLIKRTESNIDATARKPTEQKKENSDSTIVLGESEDSSNLVAFVAMPFSEKTSQYPAGYFDEVLKHLITPAAVKANFNARTAKKSGSDVIQSTIINDLDAADLVIVDLSEHNPNVLFELGMRIAFDKPVCLIRAKGTAAIFDIDHMLRVYDYNPCLWPSTLEQDIPGLSEHITQTWAAKGKERSYLSILRDNKQ